MSDSLETMICRFSAIGSVCEIFTNFQEGVLVIWVFRDYSAYLRNNRCTFVDFVMRVSRR